MRLDDKPQKPRDAKPNTTKSPFILPITDRPVPTPSLPLRPCICMLPQRWDGVGPTSRSLHGMVTRRRRAETVGAPEGGLVAPRVRFKRVEQRDATLEQSYTSSQDAERVWYVIMYKVAVPRIRSSAEVSGVRRGVTRTSVSWCDASFRHKAPRSFRSRRLCRRVLPETSCCCRRRLLGWGSLTLTYVSLQRYRDGSAKAA